MNLACARYVISAADMERALGFYRDVLGGTVTNRKGNQIMLTRKRD